MDTNLIARKIQAVTYVCENARLLDIIQVLKDDNVFTFEDELFIIASYNQIEALIVMLERRYKEGKLQILLYELEILPTLQAKLQFVTDRAHYVFNNQHLVG